MAVENPTTYTKVDPNSRFTVTSNKVTWAGLKRDEDAYVYDDKGVDHFNGDFEHLVDFFLDTGWETNAIVIPWCLANTIDDARAMLDSTDDALLLFVEPSPTKHRLFMYEFDGSSYYFDTYQLAKTSTWTLYLKVKRDESIGTYGTIYCYVYSDAARTTLLDTLSIVLHSSKKDFRYVYYAQSWNTANTQAAYGYSQNLDLQEPEAVAGVPTMLMMGVG